MERRLFIKTLAASLLVPTALPAQAKQTGRWLNLKRPQSGEVLSVVYKRNGLLDERAYRQICHVMRDVKADQASVIDVRLLDIMDGIRVALTQAGVLNPTFLVHSAASMHHQVESLQQSMAFFQVSGSGFARVPRLK